MLEDKKNTETLVDPDLLPSDYSDNYNIAKKALSHVVDIYKKLSRIRRYTRGGVSVDIAAEWDKRYRAYKCIYVTADHSYNGEARVFNPALRKAVNTIESEASNALFSRDDYFSIDAQGMDPANDDMASRAFGVIKYYSDNESYVNQYELAIKQALIYDSTCVENMVIKNNISGVFRRIENVPVRDPQSGEPLIDNDGNVVMKKVSNIYKYDENVQSSKIEVRDIYRMYFDHRLNNPEDGDMIYRDSISSQDLLRMAELGVYNKTSVEEMLKGGSNYSNSIDNDYQEVGSGKTFITDNENLNKLGGEGPFYEVLRFQGLFTIRDEDSGQRIRQEFWIDIGERSQVLRCMPNPLIGNYKTFSVCNYDTMPFEFYSDSVLSPYLSLQHALNDKENQSLDALTFNLNAPFEVVSGAKIKQSDLTRSRKTPNMLLEVQKAGSISKLTVETPVNHLNMEMSRMDAQIAQGTGATSLASGSPTGTQVDRSGKALGTLLAQTRSQFSKFVRKVERDLIQKSLQKSLNLIVQFFDSPIEIELDGEAGVSLQSQSPAEIYGRFNIKVSAGSEYLKEKDDLDSLLQFMSIAGMNDQFMAMLDKASILKAIAKKMPGNFERFIDEKNALSQMQAQIEQLNGALQQQQGTLQSAMTENKRLVGVVKQTDKAAQASPSLNDMQDNQNKVKAALQQPGQ